MLNLSYMMFTCTAVLTTVQSRGVYFSKSQEKYTPEIEILHLLCWPIPSPVQSTSPPHSKTNQMEWHVNATQVDYPEIAEGIFPRHRFMSAYEQKVIAPCYLSKSTLCNNLRTCDECVKQLGWAPGQKVAVSAVCCRTIRDNFIQGNLQSKHHKTL